MITREPGPARRYRYRARERDMRMILPLNESISCARKAPTFSLGLMIPSVNAWLV